MVALSPFTLRRDGTGWLSLWKPNSLCLLCDDPADRPIALCEVCETLLPKLGSACYQCGLPLPAAASNTARCGRCLTHPPHFERTICGFYYELPVSSFLLRYKCAGKFSMGTALATLFSQKLQAIYGESPKPQAIIPVPLHPKRLRERGFNQALEIAKHLAKPLGIPILPQAATRCRHTAAQRSLSKTKRRTNAAGAFVVNLPIAPERVAIVDDVMTTGETANALARCLKRAGVNEITLWCLARTKEPTGRN